MASLHVVTTHLLQPLGTHNSVLRVGRGEGPRWREVSRLVAERGTKSSARLTQIGGAVDHPTTVIPELRLGVGGTEVTLAKVHLFSPPVGNDSSYGLLGVDVFANAREVTIDFRAMRLIVR
jgi:hypothetical protein